MSEAEQYIIDRFTKDFYKKSVSKGYNNSFDEFKSSPATTAAVETYSQHLNTMRKVVTHYFKTGELY